MGVEMSNQDQDKNFLKVANLNFSGQESSPFQYFSHEHKFQEEELNQIFQQTIKKSEINFDNEKVMSNISKIDKAIKAARYSPLYNKSCGILNGKFVNKDEFQREWITTFKSTYAWKMLVKKPKIEEVQHAEGKNVSKPINQNTQSKKPNNATVSKSPAKMIPERQQIKQKTEAVSSSEKKQEVEEYSSFEECYKDNKVELEQLQCFDYLIYSAILRYVYEHSDLDSIIRDRACNKYRGFMEEFFSKPFLNDNKKIIETINFIIRNDIDVLFVQEATQKLCNELQKRNPDYRFIMSKAKTGDPGLSVIIFKESSFKKATIGRKGNLKLLHIINDNKILDDIKNRFLKWGKCSFISIDNFILISCHEKAFTRDMENDLKLIHKKFPGKYVIVGGTLTKSCQRANNDSNSQNITQYKMFPTSLSNTTSLATCYKKRTWMQFQKKKAGNLIKSQTNFILYDQRLEIAEPENSKSQIYKGIFTVSNTLVQINADQEDDPKKMGKAIQKSEQKKKIKLLKEKVTNQNGNEKQINIELLPSQEHPFDQLIVLTTLSIPTRKPKIQVFQLTKQEKERLKFQTSSSEELSPPKKINILE